jgi:hypothetical protein
MRFAGLHLQLDRVVGCESLEMLTTSKRGNSSGKITVKEFSISKTFANK